jgi:hypothetical protein
MTEVVRACMLAGRLAEVAEFFSLGSSVNPQGQIILKELGPRTLFPLRSRRFQNSWQFQHGLLADSYP